LSGEEYLSEMSRVLERDARWPQSVTLYRPVGVGKTSLALQYAWSRALEGDLDAVIWIDATNTDTLRKSYTQAVKALGLKVLGDYPTSNFLGWLCRTDMFQ
jgi:KaiC/GvpD/RAD55 family RecA-like ATPase